MATVLLVVLLAALVLLDLAAWFKGADSRDACESDEWELRRLWRSMR